MLRSTGKPVVPHFENQAEVISFYPLVSVLKYNLKEIQNQAVLRLIIDARRAKFNS
jgi:hypothetical protein